MKKIELKWGYNSLAGSVNNSFITETVKTNSSTDEDSYFAYFSDLSYIRGILNKNSNSRNKENLYITLFEVFGMQNIIPTDFACFQFLAFLSNIIRESSIRFLNNNKDSSVAEYQNTVNAACDSLSAVLNCFNTSESNNTFTDLFKKVKEYIEKIDSEKICSGELINAFKEYVENNKRCIGMYDFADGSQKTVTFSGYLDCEDKDIITAFKLSEDCKTKMELFDELEKICLSMGCRLVKTNKNISHFYYLFYEDPIEIEKKTLDELLKPLTYNPDIAKKYKKYFSCCERKLFSEFGEKSGTVYITKPPCQKCRIALLYYELKGISISVVVPENIFND